MKRLALVGVFVAITCALALAQMTPPPQMPAGQQAPVAQQAPRPMPASPAGSSATQVGGKWATPKPGAEPRYSDGKWIAIEYGRPILRGRKNIFGAGADYGKTVNSGAPVWRAGANVTTRLKTEVPLVLGGKTIPAGEYSVFVDLKPGKWTLILSTQPYQQKYDPNNKIDTWGSFNYDPKFDVLRAPMTVGALLASIDQFTINFVNVTDTGGQIEMSWEKTRATVNFEVGS